MLADSVAVGIAVGLVGAVFGVLARGAGLDTAKTVAMSMLVFTGASQLSAVGVLASGGAPATAVGSALLLAARNALYGPVVAPWLRGDRRSTRVVATQLVIDESTGIGAAQDAPADQRRGFLAAGIAVYVFWNLGTALGAVAGDRLDADAVSQLGLDAAFPAAFVALLLPHLRSPGSRAATVAGGVLALVSIPILPTGTPVLVAALGAGFGALRSHRHHRPSGGER